MNMSYPELRAWYQQHVQAVQNLQAWASTSEEAALSVQPIIEMHQARAEFLDAALGAYPHDSLICESSRIWPSPEGGYRRTVLVRCELRHRHADDHTGDLLGNRVTWGRK
jgi:hypothetical protein